MSTRTLNTAVIWAATHLEGTDSPRLDAEMLLCHVLGQPRSVLYTWPDRQLSDPQDREFEVLIERRRAGEPIAYLTGHREFWNLDLLTRVDTLIPRPDTETLVEAVLARVSRNRRDVLDLGTGTGAIALALASERPQWQVTGVDNVDAAVALARENAERNRLTRVRFVQSDWCEQIAANSLDVLVSNPPYVRRDDPHLTQGDVRFEPASALVSGADGLNDIRRIVRQSQTVLRVGGWLFLEHGYDQADDVALLLIDAGFEHVETVRDLGQQPRVTLGRRSIRID